MRGGGFFVAGGGFRPAGGFCRAEGFFSAGDWGRAAARGVKAALRFFFWSSAVVKKPPSP